MYTNHTAVAPSYNSRLVDLFLQLVKSEYPQVQVDPLLAETGLKIYEVSDPGHWFEQGQVEKFIDRLVALTGNANLSRDVGRYAASSQVMGTVRQHILGQLSPEKIFSLIHMATRNFSRGVEYKTQMYADNRLEVTVVPGPGMVESHHLCAYRRGFIEELIKLLNVESPELKHPECLHAGGEGCRYLISWRVRRSARWVRLRSYAIVVVLLLNLLGLVLAPQLVLQLVAPVSLGLLVLLVLLVGWMVKKDLQHGIVKLRQSAEDLIDELNVSYNTSQLLPEIGQVLSRKADVDEILAEVCRILEERLDFDRGVILLVNEARTCLQLKAAFGEARILLENADDYSFLLNHSDTRGLFIQAMNALRPLLVEDVSEIDDRVSVVGQQLLRKAGVDSFISCPIACGGEVLGVLVVDSANRQRPLRKGDMVPLMGISSIVGISIHNARLLTQRSAQFNSIMQVLSASIDARDFLTAGHSERVTHYSVEICKELGLSGEQIEVVRVAALLHDYGKIGIPDFILKKEGDLSEEERALVETHPARTREILERISFEGGFRQVPQIAGGHHEKYDGTGYPYGLKGEEIPLGARIIAVADFFEAITAKRHYRGPMTLQKAMELLRDGCESHFDPKIVSALINYIVKNKGSLLEEDGEQITFFHRHVRVACRCQVSGKVGRRTINGSSANLSVGGMFVATESKTEPGDEIDLVFALPTFPERLVRCRCRVAWVNPEDKISPLPVGFGAEFLDLSQHDAEEIKGLVSRIFAGE